MPRDASLPLRRDFEIVVPGLAPGIDI